ncbi:hypothetical protein E2C01_050630 [Portunus trituberculatus]|uniref:Uncharacterized protein n=1 Tax=Portunus trituberculatus TaxID=210409 RepID=A0A5B7GGW8_PORTR|nr:hypothetical protein [Portunus trituberculatus]
MEEIQHRSLTDGGEGGEGRRRGGKEDGGEGHIEEVRGHEDYRYGRRWGDKRREKEVNPLQQYYPPPLPSSRGNYCYLPH